MIQKRAAEVAKGILVKGSIFNMAALDNAGYKGIREALEKVELEERDPQQRIRRYKEIMSPEITRDVINFTVNELTRGLVPERFNDYVHVQFEGNGGPREIEKKLKEGDRQELIKKVYGDDVRFGRKFDTFGRKDRITASLVKLGHDLRTAVRSLRRKDVAAHSDVRSYQSAAVLNSKVESGQYPRLGPLGKRSLLGRSRLRPN